ncbi:uncharacterized protein LOC124860744 [Girardinichthys multiradiatus]|uniref:uncharacterized protein LOC124860744 n=1 Tax=Girardinichthys multiradiatus TaxID=208333 RepID=UPI001FACAD0B|nr:uncharacterized protein LOC124860744 [Girardinichthys multiradiatus]
MAVALDKVELCAFVGMLLLASMIRSRGKSAASLWDAKNGQAIYTAALTLKRFYALYALGRFDDPRTQAKSRAKDKLAAIRVLWDTWSALLPTKYVPGPEVTVDEQLGGIDNLNKLLAAYSCRGMTRRWTAAVFHNIDVSTYNTFVLWRETNPRWMSQARHRRRLFLEHLSRVLATLLVEHRVHLPRIPACILDLTWGRLSMVLYVFHFLTVALTVDLFTTTCLHIVDSHCLVQVYNSIPGVLQQLFGLGHG